MDRQTAVMMPQDAVRQWRAEYGAASGSGWSVIASIPDEGVVIYPQLWQEFTVWAQDNELRLFALESTELTHLVAAERRVTWRWRRLALRLLGRR